MSPNALHFPCFQVNELKPYRQERNQERNQRKQLDSEDRAIFAGVQYKSEAELDQAIKVVEDRLAHAGGLPLREEMSLVKEVTRLNVRCPALNQLFHPLRLTNVIMMHSLFLCEHVMIQVCQCCVQHA